MVTFVSLRSWLSRFGRVWIIGGGEVIRFPTRRRTSRVEWKDREGGSDMRKLFLKSKTFNFGR